MTVRYAKFKSALFLFLLIIIEITVSELLTSNSFRIEVAGALKIASAVCLLSFVLNFIVWKKLSNELLSPYTVFLSVLFVFCCGQCIGWLFGLDMGSKDMWNRIDHGITKQLLLQGLLYSTVGITCFNLGAIIGTNCDCYYNGARRWTVEETTNAFTRMSKLLLIIAVPAFVANTYISVNTVIQSGYASIYAFQQTSSILMRVLDILANYYQPCLLLLLIAYRQERKKRRFILLAMLLDVILNLFIGGRSGAVMSLLAIILAYHYFVIPFTKRRAVVGVVVGYFVIALLNAIAVIRDVVNKGLGDFLPALAQSFTNVIGEFVGELGWSITSICWTMNLVPSRYSFRYGMSYIVSILSWIPSGFFPGIHPVVKWGELSTWLQNVLGMTYGPGYTMIAEAYLNFGLWGYVALLIEGIIIAKCIAQISRKCSEENLLKSTIQIMFIMVLMKSLVRSSISIAVRQYIFVILPLLILIRLSIRKRS